MSVERLLEGNKRFVSDVFKDGSDFTYCLQGQSPHTLVIACADSRVPPELILGANPGDIFIHRNIGNMVPPGDWNLATVMEYAVRHLGVTTVAVLGHGCCGAIKAIANNHGSERMASDGFFSYVGSKSDDVFIPGWVINGEQAYETLSERMPYPSEEAAQVEWLCELEKENIRLQVKNLRNYPIIRAALADRRISVAGLYYDMATGVVSQVAG
ncbi:MAG: carbonic anhydrase [Euryarchaeota archaeon]|nr:carbonic anhydrase [Euryarchaeota archaeon]